MWELEVIKKKYILKINQDWHYSTVKVTAESIKKINEDTVEIDGLVLQFDSEVLIDIEIPKEKRVSNTRRVKKSINQ
jgi:hypothetical protein